VVRFLVVALIALGAAAGQALAPPVPVITTAAGSGAGGFSGDGGQATATALNVPIAVASMPDGSFLIADLGNHRVRRVAPDGTITTVAGTGVGASGGDNGPATAADLVTPRGVAGTADGGFLIADRDANRIRKVAADGTITTVAGTGAGGFGGDNGPATQAQLNQPYAASPTADGGFLIADRGNHRIRKVAADGTVTTVAGTGAGGFAGDNGPATQAQLNAPCMVLALPDGSFLIPDRDNQRVRKVASDGTITTFAGTGVAGAAGDGGPATQAQLSGPYSVSVAPGGGVLIGERNGQRVRMVASDGTITTVAGTGGGGFAGDGGLATLAQISAADGLALMPDGSFLIADTGNNRIRRVALGTPVATPAAGALAPAASGPAGAGPAAAARGALHVSLSILGRPLSGRVGLPVRIRYRSSVAGRVLVVVRKGRRFVLRTRPAAKAGLNVVRLRGFARPGTYLVRMTLPGGAAAGARLVVRAR